MTKKWKQRELPIQPIENCDHSSDGWCLDCVRDLHKRMESVFYAANMLNDAFQNQSETIKFLLEVTAEGDDGDK